MGELVEMIEQNESMVIDFDADESVDALDSGVDENAEGAVEAVIPDVELTSQQRAGYEMLLPFARGQKPYSMALLEGFAGTGKTYLIGRLIHAFLELERGRRIAIAAPTNKAVQVLVKTIEELTGIVIHPTRQWDETRRQMKRFTIEFGSIHSFLGLQMQERDDGSQECRQKRNPNLHEFALVIVDECSMLDKNLISRISQAKRNALVLFVGDPAQLPPVSDGGTLSPVFEAVTHKAVLTEVVRQAADNPMIRLSLTIRDHMQYGQKISLHTLIQSLPPLPAKAGVVSGGFETVIAIAVTAIRDGEDARVVAFRNQQVLAYNARIHEALHGYTRLPFVSGERVIVHQQFEDAQIEEPETEAEAWVCTTLITSEELVADTVYECSHPKYPQIPAIRLRLLQQSGQHVLVYVALDQDMVDHEVNRLFGEWRQHKSEAEALQRAGRHKEADKVEEQAKTFSAKAWMLRKAFCQLRHAYAMTAHKSQGSTYDTAVIDFSDLNRIQDPAAFNRGLYVAVTRPREHLAVVV